MLAGALAVSGPLAFQLIGHPLPAFQQARLQRVTAQPTGQDKETFEGQDIKVR